MADENQQPLVAVVNLGLTAEMFAAVAAHRSLVGAGPVAAAASTAALSEALIGRDSDGPREVCFCFTRKADASSAAVTRDLDEIRKTLEAIDARIERVSLVDCGDSFMEPLSNTAILGMLVELVRDILDDGVDVVVFAADDDADSDEARITVRDTRTEAFVEHVARFTRLALRSLYSDLPEETGAAVPPEPGVSFETAAEQVLRAHKIPIADGDKVHWLRRAI